MKKYLLFAAASFALSSAAHAAPVGMPDNDGSAAQMNYTATAAGNDGEDYGSPITAQFTVKGKVMATCSIYGVDSEGTGLKGTVDLGTIGITAGDELAAGDLFNMTGPASAHIHSDGAGCNAENKVSVTKSINGLVNAAPGVYDSDQFQANIPYSADLSFTGRLKSAGTGGGTLQHVNVNATSGTGSNFYGAWRSPLNLDLTIPKVTGHGLVAGTYSDTVTVTIALS